MDNSNTKSIVDYLSPSSAVMITGGAFVVLSPLVYLIASLIAAEKLLPIVCGCCTAFVGLIMICMTLSSFVSARTNVKKYTARFKDDVMYNDFKNGKCFLSDRIKCGSRFVFSKGTGTMLAYEDIVEIVRTKNHYRSVETGMNIYAKLKNGKRVLLCAVFNADGDESKLNSAVEYMMSYMPAVTVTNGII